jgi:CRISPR-associated protein Csx17
MNANPPVLPVIPVQGLRPTSLGSYLTALGLLRVLSRRWPSVRAAWRDGLPHIVGGPPNRDALAEAVMTVADQASWTPYARGWAGAQRASTKAKSGAKLALWQAEAGEDELELFASHAAPASRVFFNPLLGSGGNAGKRAFADGWKKATDALKPAGFQTKGTNADDRREALYALLDGEASAWQADKLNAAGCVRNAKKSEVIHARRTDRAHCIRSEWCAEGRVASGADRDAEARRRLRPVSARWLPRDRPCHLQGAA